MLDVEAACEVGARGGGIRHPAEHEVRVRLDAVEPWKCGQVGVQLPAGRSGQLAALRELPAVPADDAQELLGQRVDVPDRQGPAHSSDERAVRAEEVAETEAGDPEHFAHALDHHEVGIGRNVAFNASAAACARELDERLIDDEAAVVRFEQAREAQDVLT